MLISVAASPAQATIQDIRSASEKIAAELTEKKQLHNKLLDRKFLDQFTDISPAAAEQNFPSFIATSLLLLKTMKCHLKSMIVANF